MPQHVVDLPRLQHLHEGQGPARRALHHQPHLRDLRRQPRHLLGLRAEHGLRRAPAAPRRVDHQPRRGRRVHVRPQHLPGEPGRGGLLREDGQARPTRACWSRRTAPRRRTPATHGYRTIGDIMRSLNPLEGEFYREALQVSRYTREMFCLMEGRHVHPSTLYPGGVGTVATIQLFTDYLTRLMRYVEFMKRVVPLHDDLFDFFYEALPGYEEVGRRRILLGCWGSAQRPRRLRLHLREHDRLGPARCSSPRASSSTASSSPTTWSTSTSASGSCSAARSTTTGRSRRCSSSSDPLGNPVDRRHPWNQHTHPAAAEARLRRQVQLGHVAALVRRHGPPRARHRRRPDRPAVVHRAGRPGRHRLRQGHRAQRADQPAPDGDSSPRPRSSGRSRSGATRSSATAPGPTSRPTRRPSRCTSSRRRWPRSAPAAPRPGRRSRCPTRPSACGFTEAVRGVLSHHMVIRDGKIANYHPYPPTPWNGSVARHLRHARARTRTRCRTRRSSRRTRRRTSRASTSCARSAASTRACRAASTCTSATGRTIETHALARRSRSGRTDWAADHDRTSPGAESQRVEELLDELRQAGPRPRPRRPRSWSALLSSSTAPGLARIVDVARAERASCSTRSPTTSWWRACCPARPAPARRRRPASSAALDRVRPYLGSHAGGVEYLGVDEDGVAHLRLEGSCDGCPSSTVTVRLAVEDAVVEAAPEVIAVEVEGVAEAPAEAAADRARPGSPRDGRRPARAGAPLQARTAAPTGVGGDARARGQPRRRVLRLPRRLPGLRRPRRGQLDGDALACPRCAAGTTCGWPARLAPDGHLSPCRCSPTAPGGRSRMPGARTAVTAPTGDRWSGCGRLAGRGRREIAGVAASRRRRALRDVRRTDRRASTRTWSTSRRAGCCAPAGRATCCSPTPARGAGRFRAVPERYRTTRTSRSTEAEWDDAADPGRHRVLLPQLGARTASSRFYPSPAGATESLLDLAPGTRWSRTNPVLARRGARRRGPHRCAAARRRVRVLPRADRRLLRAGRPDPAVLGGFDGGAEVWAGARGFFEPTVRARRTPPAMPAA